MTNEELQIAITTIAQASRDGILEVYDGRDSWVRYTSNPLGSYTYRIKPKPREVWVPTVSLQGSGGCLTDVIFNHEPATSWKDQFTKFREVIE